MYSTPLYFADAQITDAFENLPIHPLCSNSQKGDADILCLCTKANIPPQYPILKEQPAL